MKTVVFVTSQTIL